MTRPLRTSNSRDRYISCIPGNRSPPGQIELCSVSKIVTENIVKRIMVHGRSKIPEREHETGNAVDDK